MGIRSHPQGLARSVRRLLETGLVEGVDAPPNYWVRFERREPGRPGPARSYALYRSRCLLLRTRKRERALRALGAALAAYALPLTGLVRLRQLAVIGDAGAVLVPPELHWQVEGVEPRLAEHGLSVLDPPFIELDPETLELVRPLGVLGVGGSVDDSPGGPEGGRYRIVEWTILTRDRSARLGTHDALASLIPAVEAPTPTSSALEPLSRVLATTRLEPIWYDGSAGLVDRLLRAG